MFDGHVLDVRDNLQKEPDLIYRRVHCTLLKSLGIKSKQLRSRVSLRRILVRFHRRNFGNHRIRGGLEEHIRRLESGK